MSNKTLPKISFGDGAGNTMLIADYTADEARFEKDFDEEYLRSVLSRYGGPSKIDSILALTRAPLKLYSLHNLDLSLIHI